MGGMTAPVRLAHFFQHLGLPEMSDQDAGSMIENAEKSMREAGHLGPDEALVIKKVSLDDLRQTDPALADGKLAARSQGGHDG